MPNELLKFLLRMGEDLQLQRDYANDPESVMTHHGLSEAQKAAMRKGDEAEIMRMTSEDQGSVVYKFIARIPKPRSSRNS